MAFDDYFRETPGHRPPQNSSFRPSPEPSFVPYSSTASLPYSPSHTPAPVYSSTDHLPANRDSWNVHFGQYGSPAGASTPYSDDIPLKRKSNGITSSDDWRDQETRYTRSPESPKAPSLPAQPAPTTERNGFFTGKIPWVVFTMTLVQCSVFIAEIIKNSIVTGSPIMIHPQFNPMIGPSTYILINMGARFVPCMRITPGVQDSTTLINWPCPNTTTSDPNAQSNHCDLSALCGFTGVNDADPNQWFRFITPMFLHAGLVHIGFNMLLQLTMGREMELAIGSIRFGLVYFSSGIFGFVLGGNFAATAIASTGASGCLFGILALTLLDLIYCWNERPSPVKDLMWIIADILVSFVLGLLPGLDNFSHIGGFLMGLGAGICILHSPNILRQRIGDALPYRSMQMDKARSESTSDSRPTTAKPADVGAFTKEPVGFFKGRKPLWWAWWLIRAGALIGVLVGFVVLLNDFYQSKDRCSWCKYLSCLPINNWCNIGNLQLSNTTSTNKMRRGALLSGSGHAPVAVERLFELASS